ncbi:MAG: PH domain-containing protein [Clostridia bacterium]|nr:PH domain-containing protein [Clostridia bacterium]
MQEKKVLWNDRKRIIFGLPWTFTKYKLTEEKLIIQTGFFNIKQEEIRLYRIMDITLNRKFGQRIFGLGTIHCCSADKSTPEFDIKNIKKSEAVKELLSDKVEQERQRKRVSSREYMHADDDNDDIGDDDLHND